MHFFDFLFPPRADEALIRDISVDAFLQTFRPHAIPTKPETVALFSFAEPVVRSAIHEAKYHESSHAFDLLSTALTEYLRDADDQLRNPILMPIPLGKERRKERGYNQAEEIALRASKELGVLVETSLLMRMRETASQVSLPSEARRENMRGAFRVTRSISPAHTYIVIDDVITTGATLQSAIDALTEAGATHILPIALAH
jgi:ComF family protein